MKSRKGSGALKKLMSILLVAAMLAAFASPALADGTATVTEDAAKPVVQTSTVATKELAPDYATVLVTVSASDPVATRTAQAANTTAVSDLTKALNAKGIASDQIHSTFYRTYKSVGYNNDTGDQYSVYVVDSGLTVKVEDIKKVGSVLDAAAEINGCTVTGVKYEVADPLQYRNEIVKQAITEAKATLGAAAEALGMTLGGIVSVDIQVNTSNSIIPMYAYYDARGLMDNPETVRVTATVTLICNLK